MTHSVFVSMHPDGSASCKCGAVSTKKQVDVDHPVWVEDFLYRVQKCWCAGPKGRNINDGGPAEEQKTSFKNPEYQDMGRAGRKEVKRVLKNLQAGRDEAEGRNGPIGSFTSTYSIHGKEYDLRRQVHEAGKTVVRSIAKNVVVPLILIFSIIFTAFAWEKNVRESDSIRDEKTLCELYGGTYFRVYGEDRLCIKSGSVIQESKWKGQHQQ